MQSLMEACKNDPNLKGGGQGGGWQGRLTGGCEGRTT